jgi:hypothetical protein
LQESRNKNNIQISKLFGLSSRCECALPVVHNMMIASGNFLFPRRRFPNPH